MKKRLTLFLSLLLALSLLFSGCELLTDYPFVPPPDSGNEDEQAQVTYADLAAIPAYSGSPYVILNGDVPTFTAEEITTLSYEYFSPLDALGRCGYAEASVGIDLMPTEDRPLASTKEAIEARYRERYPRYSSVADCRIAVTGDVKTVAETIAQEFLSEKREERHDA